MGNILNIIVVGYGFAGQVHAKTYRSLTHSCHLAGIVECSNEHRSVAKRTLSGASVYETLDQALADIGSDVVVDFCVPAPQNIKLAKTAVSFGVNRIMLEKPLGWSYPMAISLEEILHERDAIYLDTYLSSLGLSHLKEWIARERSEIDRVHIKFHKNRITDSFKGRGFDSDTPPDAWHIEGRSLP